MRILSRYILLEFLIPLGYCLTGFISIYVLFELFGSFTRLIEAKIPIGDIILYFCGYLAPYFHYLTPAALMLATLYTMWSFCRHSEIVAMRASGVSFLAIAMPILAVATLLAACVVYVNESFVPYRAHWAALMKTEKFDHSAVGHAENIVFRNPKDSRTWKIDRMLDADSEHLDNVRVSVDRPGGARLCTITAERADYLDGEWWFTNPIVQHHDINGQEIASPTPQLDGLRFRCFSDFRERPSDFLMQNRPWKFNSVRDRFRYLRTHRDLTDEARNDRLYDTWAQIMSPFACLIITLFAIPAGIASGRQSVFKGILGALCMFFSFYGVSISFMVVAKNGWCNPVVAAIMPHALFLALGIRSFYKQR